MEVSSSYAATAKMVQAATPSGKGKKITRRHFKGRVLPKAAIRKLALKANIDRMSDSAEAVKNYDYSKSTYDFIDRKVYNMMENVIYDVIAITSSKKRSSTKPGVRIVKERQMIKALERYGGIGLGTNDARRTLDMKH